MEFFTRTVYCSFLVLAVIIHQNEAQERFGCPNGIESFALQLPATFNAFFGENLTPFPYTNVTRFNQDLQLISAAIGDMMQNNIYSDVDDLIDFYNFYEGNKQENSMLNLFNGYHPIYRQHTHLYRLVDVFDKLLNLVPYRIDTEAHSYIVTVDSSTNYDEMTTIGSQNGIPNYFQHEHVAAVIKFQIFGREGFLLIHPSIIFNHVAVVMKDGGPLPDGVFLQTGNLLHYQMLGTDYILATGLNNAIYFLYYVGKPFCSVLDIHTRSKLLEVSGLIEKQNQFGLEVTKAEFQFLSSSLPFIALESSVVNKKTAIVLSPSESLSQSASKDPATNNIYNQVLYTFNAHSYDVLGRLEAIRRIGLDKKFINEVTSVRILLDDYRTSLKYEHGTSNVGSAQAPIDLDAPGTSKQDAIDLDDD